MSRFAVPLLCPVRGCGGVLDEGARTLVCPRGHAFDRARSGYVNLLQPQDRRSREPGDSPAAVAARRRLYDAGLADALVAAVSAQLAEISVAAGKAILDVGCGEGSLLGRVAVAGDLAGTGVDLSASAVDLAARRHPELRWVVANADRTLPFPTASYPVVLTIASRLHAPEVRRVLAPEGFLIAAVPAADDLIELREAVLGEGRRRERLDDALAGFADDLELESRTTVTSRPSLEVEALRDLLATTYRGARVSERARVDRLEPMRVTLSFDLARLRRR